MALALGIEVLVGLSVVQVVLPVNVLEQPRTDRLCQACCERHACLNPKPQALNPKTLSPKHGYWWRGVLPHSAVLARGRWGQMLGFRVWGIGLRVQGLGGRGQGTT